MSVGIKENIYTAKSGKFFGDVGAGIALMFLLAGILTAPYGFFLLLISAYLSFTTYGVKINAGKNQLMYYVQHFGLFYTGKWRENKVYSDIAILGATETSLGNVRWMTISKYHVRTIRIVLLDKYHIKRIVLIEANTVEEAEKIAQEISAQTGFPVVKFNPVRLTATRRR